MNNKNGQKKKQKVREKTKKDIWESSRDLPVSGA